MDKGVRKGILVKFNEMVSNGQLKELGGRKFRRTLMDWAMEQYSVTNSAAATHYNFAFHDAKKNTPEAVAGLGRAEGKNNGGRKKKPVATAVDPVDAAAEAGKEAVAQTLEAAVGNAEAEVAAAKGVDLFTVTKKDGTVIAEGLTQEQADDLVAKAKAAKKGNLLIK